jgi:hypothetical protein
MTQFRELKVGDRFVMPGQKTVFVKVSEDHVKQVGAKRPVWFPVRLDLDVVPENGATVDDILGSWMKLGR